MTPPVLIRELVEETDDELFPYSFHLAIKLMPSVCSILEGASLTVVASCDGRRPWASSSATWRGTPGTASQIATRLPRSAPALLLRFWPPDKQEVDLAIITVVYYSSNAVVGYITVVIDENPSDWTQRGLAVSVGCQFVNLQWGLTIRQL